MSENDPSRCAICALIARLDGGDETGLVAALPNSYVLIGDSQFYRGYCVIFARRHARELFLIEKRHAMALFDEVVECAAAIASVVKPLKMNYECLGNQEPHVHWHLLPRYESDALRRMPIWLRAESERRVQLPQAEMRELTAALGDEIARRITAARLPASRR
jgi:diadenosine tetraphosphate (Ap4A) HIT family hydrolase